MAAMAEVAAAVAAAGTMPAAVAATTAASAVRVAAATWKVAALGAVAALSTRWLAFSEHRGRIPRACEAAPTHDQLPGRLAGWVVG